MSNSRNFARVIAQHRGLVRVKLDESGLECWAELSGKLRRESERLVVGDYVDVSSPMANGRSQILEVLPRRSLFQRTAAGTGGELQLIAANIDLFLIVTSANEDFSPRRIERYLAMAKQAGVKAFLVLSKSDLCAQDKRVMLELQLPADLEWLWLSAKSQEGFEELKSKLHPGETFLMMGSSGVGKSSIMNRLIENDLQAVQDIREADAKGRHTTTARSLFELPNGSFLIDTPGIRELRLSADEESISEVFSDIGDLSKACRYRDCSHNSEPGCKVLEAIKQGKLDPARLKNLQKLHREQEAAQRRPHEKVEAKQKIKIRNQDLRRIYKERGR